MMDRLFKSISMPAPSEQRAELYRRLVRLFIYVWEKLIFPHVQGS
jgi:hypothetical protein